MKNCNKICIALFICSLNLFKYNDGNEHPNSTVGVKSIHLLCGNPLLPAANLTSIQGTGITRPIKVCNESSASSRVIGFSLRIDFSANANNCTGIDMITFACKDGNTIELVEAFAAVTAYNATYTAVALCPDDRYICGLRTGGFYQQGYDDLALAEAQFVCCKW